jgi:hypothetical protein
MRVWLRTVSGSSTTSTLVLDVLALEEYPTYYLLPATDHRTAVAYAEVADPRQEPAGTAAAG